MNLIEGRICLCSDLAMDTYNLNDSINNKVGDFFQKNISWLEKQFTEYKSSQKASEFFAGIQGAQLISRNQKRIDYFDEIITKSIDDLLLSVEK